MMRENHHNSTNPNNYSKTRSTIRLSAVDDHNNNVAASAKRKKSQTNSNHNRRSTNRSSRVRHNRVSEPGEDDDDDVFNDLGSNQDDEDIDSVIKRIEKEFLSNRSKSQNRSKKPAYNTGEHHVASRGRSKLKRQTYDHHDNKCKSCH